jgi:hypothetical protein
MLGVICPVPLGIPSFLSGSTAPMSHKKGRKMPRKPRTKWPFRKVMRATVKMRKS